jgi:hypothetical protein
MQDAGYEISCVELGFAGVLERFNFLFLPSVLRKTKGARY